MKNVFRSTLLWLILKRFFNPRIRPLEYKVSIYMPIQNLYAKGFIQAVVYNNKYFYLVSSDSAKKQVSLKIEKDQNLDWTQGYRNAESRFLTKAITSPS